MTLDPIFELNYKILPATLSVGGQIVATGKARVEVENHNGVFWPTDQVLLDKSYPQASLRFQGIAHDIPVTDVKKCRADLAAHWDFQLEPRHE